MSCQWPDMSPAERRVCGRNPLNQSKPRIRGDKDPFDGSEIFSAVNFQTDLTDRSSTTNEHPSCGAMEVIEVRLFSRT